MANNSSSRPPMARQLPNPGMENLAKLLPIAIAIVLTNGVVIFLFYKRRSLRTPSNILLLGLALCDFLTGAVNIPYFIIFSFQVVPRTSAMFEDFAHWLFAFHTLVAVSAAYHILAITAEKYLAIIRPLKHYLVTVTTALKVMAAIWVVSGFIALIPFAWRGQRSHTYFAVYSAICFVIVFFVPGVLTVYAHVVMFKAARGRKKPTSTRSMQMKALQKKNSTDQKAILVLVTMCAIYLCCWLPHFTMMFVVNVNLDSKPSTAFYTALMTITITRYIASAVNPLLYAFFKRDMWFALRSLFVSKRKSSLTTSSNTMPKGRSTPTTSCRIHRVDTRFSFLSVTPESLNAKSDKNDLVFVTSV